MKLIIRADSVEIDGYVNACERNSKPLMSRIGQFIERMCAGVFRKALNRADDVHILLNHDWNRDLGSIKRGNLQLEEDAIGLHAHATITDPEVIENARNGDLVGWSFGFFDREVENAVEDGMPLRKVRDIDLKEVSLLNRSKTPAYDGTLVTVRATDTGDEIQFRSEPLISETVDTVDETTGSDEAADEAAEVLEDESEKAEERNLTTRDGAEAETPSELPVEKPVENIVENTKVNYNKAIGIISKLKETK